jgi:hypothetical protein
VNKPVSNSRELEWKIEGYNGVDKFFEERIPLSDAPEEKIASLLRGLASQHLTAAEIAAGMADVRKDAQHGKRVTLVAGQNPRYVAALFRGDEMDVDVE